MRTTIARGIPQALIFAAVLASAGCRSIDPDNPKRDFDPPLVAENDVLRLEVRRLHQRKRSLRLWIDLQNKTDEPLDLAYGDFLATAEGKTIAGAYYFVMGAKTDKGFSMRPRMYKSINRPLEFSGFDRIQTVELLLRNIRVRGQEGTSELRLVIPVRARLDRGRRDDR